MKYLYLSHWNDTMEVRIDSKLMQNMKNHHFSGVRFLYNVYKKMFKGAMLNYDQGMNYPWILQIFLNAIFKYHSIKSPVLILTSQNNIYVWHYHMNQIGEQVFLLNDKNCKEVFENSDASIILASLGDLNIIHPYRDKKFEFVIVDHFDSVASKMIFKKLSGNFNIALTNKDFMVDRNRKLLWTMLNWTNPQLFGKLADFYKKDSDHLKNLRDPYDEVWHRLTWNFCESFVKESDEEIEAYKKAIDDWKAANKLNESETVCRQKVSKRKLQQPKKNSNGKNRKRQDHSSLTAFKDQRITAIEEIQHRFDGISVNKNQENLARSSKNDPELPIISKNVQTGNQNTKFASKSNKRKNNLDRVHTKKSVHVFTEIIKWSTENKNCEKLESHMYEKQKKISQNDYSENKQIKNKSLLETNIHKKPEKLKLNELMENKLCNAQNKDKITETYLHDLEEINYNCADNATLTTENIASTKKPINVDENPQLTDVTEGSPVKETAGQYIESLDTNSFNDVEESDILLSIIEGKFSSSWAKCNTLENQKAIDSSIKNIPEKFSKSNSKSILASLFGNKAEYIENLETPKQKLDFTESNLKQKNSFSQPMLTLSDCSSSLKCAGKDYFFSEISDENKNNVSSPIIKSNYNVLESLFNFDENVHDYKTLKDKMYKLNDEQRDALVISLFGD